MVWEKEIIRCWFTEVVTGAGYPSWSGASKSASQ